MNGLRYIDGNLQLHGNTVIAMPLLEAMHAFYQFLHSFKRKCILTAHNCKFYSTRLIITTKKVFMVEHFKSVIEGFCDTLPITRKCTGKKALGDNKLEMLAKNFKINNDEAHNAICDVQMLEQVLNKLNVSKATLLASSVTWSHIEENENFSKNLPNALKALVTLNQCTSLATRKKMITAKISYDLLLNAYKENKFMGLLNILGEDENGIIRVTKCRRVVQRIHDHLNTMPNIITK